MYDSSTLLVIAVVAQGIYRNSLVMHTAQHVRTHERVGIDAEVKAKARVGGMGERYVCVDSMSIDVSCCSVDLCRVSFCKLAMGKLIITHESKIMLSHHIAIAAFELSIYVYASLPSSLRGATAYRLQAAEKALLYIIDPIDRKSQSSSPPRS